MPSTITVGPVLQLNETMLSLMLVNAHAHYRQASDVFNEYTFHSIASLITALVAAPTEVCAELH